VAWRTRCTTTRPDVSDFQRVHKSLDGATQGAARRPERPEGIAPAAELWQRNQLWSSPQYTLTWPAWYSVESVSPRWMLLQKATNRCGRATTIVTGARPSRPGHLGPVAGANQIVLARFHPGRRAASAMAVCEPGVEGRASPHVTTAASERDGRRLASGPPDHVDAAVAGLAGQHQLVRRITRSASHERSLQFQIVRCSRPMIGQDLAGPISCREALSVDSAGSTTHDHGRQSRRSNNEPH